MTVLLSDDTAARRRELTPEQAARMARIDELAAQERARVEMVLRGGSPEPQPMPPLPEPPEGDLTRKQKRAYRDRLNKAKGRRDSVVKANQAAANDETAAEMLAPAVRRRAVTNADGNVLRPEQLERDGSTFRRANPVARLAKEMPDFITDRHVDACARFVSECEEVGGGIGLGASDWGSKVSGGTPGSGVSVAKQIAILEQCRMRSSLWGALAWMGGSTEIVTAILLGGMSVPAWAKQQEINRQVAQGMLVAGLDRLADFYFPVSPGAQRIRVAFFASMHGEDEG